MAGIVAIVGRPNVGKSTLFNRLTETRAAIVNDTEGVTRDRQYGKAEWNGREFTVIDTGGYVLNSDDVFESEIRNQVNIAIDEADLLLFMVDVKNGITDLDQMIAKMLRMGKKKVIVVVNKVDNSEEYLYASEFYSLGLGDIYSISSASGSGTGDLLDVIIENIAALPSDEPEEELPRFAIIGRPNVGKSSLVNSLLDEKRNIVTDIAGTTRDSTYTKYNKFGFEFYLVDTAGLRKKAKVHDDLEFYSVMRTVRAVEHSDVCIVMIDATAGVESQDVNILHLAVKNNKGIVVLVNKWDLITKETNTTKEIEEKIRERMAPFTDFPIVFVSALTKQRINKGLESAMSVFNNRVYKVKTSELNEIMLPIIEKNGPPSIKGKFIKIKYVTQLPTHYPSFAFYCNLPQYVKAPYKRFLENQIRKHFNFNGVPINIFIRKK